jgi:cytochrome c biogenesis protein CcdA/thiol-disulfide isomerase/thioredoxin
MALYVALFLSGMATILLPCVLPLLPIVLGVSIAGRSKLRPLFTVLGMVISFVTLLYLLLVVLNRFVELADYIRIGTYYLLVLFGLGFFTHDKRIQIPGAIFGALFFIDKGWTSVIIAMIAGVLAMELGGRVATILQQFGTDVQTKARGEFGSDSPVTALIIGLTLGLVWAPCAGPALGAVLTAVREQPGPTALSYLIVYGLGTAVPLLAVGYGGQAAVHSVRAVSKYSGVIKQVAGVALILTGIALHFGLFMRLQVWVASNTNLGSIGSSIEDSLFGDGNQNSSSPSGDTMSLPSLPKLSRAPEFAGLGPWHNSEPFTMASMKGKVVLVDFWTYSCINCIRTLPYLQGYWEKYAETDKFVLIGVHSPEFTFEKSQKNVAAAIKNHGLTYPTAQDNDFKTWGAFANRYWPAKYLIDAEGYIRYTHFGEGGYEETDEAIASLLLEADPTMGIPGGNLLEPTESARRTMTPEIYLGSRSWPALANAQGEPTDDVVTYTAPASMKLHTYSLVGEWQLAEEGELQVLQSDSGEIRARWLGSEINLVLGLEDDARPVQAEVIMDGKSVKTFTVDMHDLYNLYTGEYGEHELVLKLAGKGVEGFAFTFGSK